MSDIKKTCAFCNEEMKHDDGDKHLYGKCKSIVVHPVAKDVQPITNEYQLELEMKKEWTKIKLAQIEADRRVDRGFGILVGLVVVAFCGLMVFGTLCGK
jgi:tetrahydromethanopterin S-methyltransferase subunit G